MHFSSRNGAILPQAFDTQGMLIQVCTADSAPVLCVAALVCRSAEGVNGSVVLSIMDMAIAVHSALGTITA